MYVRVLLKTAFINYYESKESQIPAENQTIPKHGLGPICKIYSVLKTDNKHKLGIFSMGRKCFSRH